MSESESSASPAPQPKWRPLGRLERRVLGVLVEKAKTTPDAYPMTLNGLTSGCNQKSNREPQMNLEPDQVENSLEKLRQLSAVIEVSGGGRVSKYRHLIYEWMGIDKVEAAVMAELLLRGAQTIGELRGRAARMEPIADLNALQPILQSLIQKKLVISLSPPGRGQIVTHGLYLPEELDKVKAGIPAVPPEEEPVGTGPAPNVATASARTNTVATPASAPFASPTAVHSASAPPADWANQLKTLQAEIEELRGELSRVKQDVQDLWSSLS